MYNSDLDCVEMANNELALAQIIRTLSDQNETCIPEQSGGFETISIGNLQNRLTVPINATSAIVMVEADKTASDLSRVIRFKENGSTPTIAIGFGLGDNDVYRIKGRTHLLNFRTIGIEADKTHRIQVQYFKNSNNIIAVQPNESDVTPLDITPQFS